MNKKFKIITIVLILLSIFLTTGFKNMDKNPKTVYRVYLKGESLGLIKSKKSFEKYIDEQNEAIKKKYKVDKVYAPTDLDIIKEITFDNKIKSNKEIYDEIKDKSTFTIDGYSIKIKGLETKDEKGKTKQGKTQTIYVLDKKVFTNSVEKTAKSFISEENYTK